MSQRQADSGGASIRLEELGAFATIAWGMIRRGGLSSGVLSTLSRGAAEQFREAGGIDGLRSLLADELGGSRPEPRAPSPAPRPASQPAAPARPLPSAEPGVLSAATVNGGSASGVARLLRESGDVAAVRPGEIVVCARPEPEWAAAVDIAGGLVLEVGTASSRLIRSARGRQIPVVRLAGATSVVPDGARVAVDGGLGRVDLR